jgi:hypothetical protein
VRALRLLAVTILFAWPGVLAAEPVDLLLVLAVDASLSVGPESHQLQREGYAKAFTNPRVLRAIRSGATHRIAVYFFEWADSDTQNVLIDWMLVDGPQSAQEFSDKLLGLPRLTFGATSISSAVDFAVQQFGRAPYRAERHIIDISGDGNNNDGRDVKLARDGALGQGITINAVSILNAQPFEQNLAHQNPTGGLTAYYRGNVIGGPGAFVLEVADFKSFGEAIVRKLIAEIAEGPAQVAE